MEQQYVMRLLPLLKAIRFYHEHEIIGMGHIPQKGGALLVVNHSLATYDIALLIAAIYETTGRISRPLADNLFFKIPYLSKAVDALGAVRGTRSNAKSLLKAGELVSVAPGGMREALRNSNEKYQLFWKERKGFVRLSIEMQVPVIIGMCPQADDLYNVYSNPLTLWAYKNYKIPIFWARGIGPTVIPRKVKLVHHLSEALYPPKMDKSKPLSLLVDAFHEKILQVSDSLIKKALKN